MPKIHIPNIDEAGNFLNPAVLARLTERYGTQAGEGSPAITAGMTLDEAAALAPNTDGA